MGVNRCDNIVVRSKICKWILWSHSVFIASITCENLYHSCTHVTCPPTTVVLVHLKITLTAVQLCCFIPHAGCDGSMVMCS